MKYAFTALARVEYTGLKLHCSADEYITMTVNGQSAEVCPFTAGEDFLKTFNFESELTVATCELALVAMAFCCFFIAFSALKRLVTKGKGT